MRQNTLEKLFKKGAMNAKYFRHIAEPIARQLAEETDEQMSEEAKVAGGFLIASGMAMGEKLCRNKYLAIGIGIGIVTSYGVGVTLLKLSSKEVTDEEVEE